VPESARNGLFQIGNKTSTRGEFQKRITNLNFLSIFSFNAPWQTNKCRIHELYLISLPVQLFCMGLSGGQHGHSSLPQFCTLYSHGRQCCCISYEANAVELGIIQVCHSENSRRAPSLPFAGALGQPFCPDFPCQAVCFCAHFCYVGALIRKRNLSTCCGY